MVAARFVAIGLWFLTGVKQDTAPEITSRQSQPVFRSAGNLVQVPVVVRDRSGHAVGNLQAGDFHLTDNGKPQLISRFTVEQAQTFESRFERPDSQSAANGGPTVPRHFVAYLADDIDTSPPAFAAARAAVLGHLDALRPAERAAVFSASGRVSLPFTGDRDLLRKTLNGINSLDRQRAWTEPSLRCSPMTFLRADLIVALDPKAIIDCSGRPASGSTGADRQTRRQSEVMEDARSILDLAERDLRTYFNAIERLIDAMSVLPGEREIVLLSPGIYVPSRYRHEENEIVNRAIRAHVTISSVDIRGVPVYFEQGGDDPAFSHSAYGMSETAERFGFLDDLAAGTGGIALRGNNDLALQLRRASSLPEYVYVLGFSPSDLTLDGKLHTIRVGLKNPRGFTWNARDKYFAVAQPSDPAESVRRQMETAFFSSEEVTDLPTRLSTQFFKEGDNATLTVTARVDASRLPFRKEGGRNRDDLMLVVGLFDQNGNFLSAFQKDIEMRLKDETLTRWLASGIETATDFPVRPGRYLVRLVVRDSEGHHMAEKSSGVEIPW